MTTSSMPWIKLETTLLDDPRLSRLTDAQRWRMVQLELLAGRCDCGGCLAYNGQPMNVEDIAWSLRTAKEELETDLQVLQKAGFIAFDSAFDAWIVAGFLDRQGPSQSERRAEWNDRQRSRREKIRAERTAAESPENPVPVTGDSAQNSDPVTGDNRVTPENVTALEKEREKEKEGEGEKEKNAAPLENEAAFRTMAPGGPPTARSFPESKSLKAKEIPAAVRFLKITGRWPVREIFPRLAHIPEADLDFWEQIIRNWRLRGWGPYDVNGMLDYYDRRELPRIGLNRPAPEESRPTSTRSAEELAAIAEKTRQKGREILDRINQRNEEYLHANAA